MDQKVTINDKITFILGFLALILALSPFKDVIDNIPIKFFGFEITLTKFILIVGALLFTSIYLYALDYIRYSFSKLVLSKFFNGLFNVIIKIADVIYAIAVLLPSFTLIFLAIEKIIVLLIPVFSEYEYLISVLNGLISITIGYIFGHRMNLEKKSKELEISKDEEEDSIIRAKKAYKDKYYEYMLIELNNGLLNLLFRKLSKKININKKAVTNRDLIELSFKKKIINSKQKALLHDIRVLRNNAAHGNLTKPITDEIAGNLIKNAEQLFNLK